MSIQARDARQNTLKRVQFGLALALLVLGIFATDHHHDTPPPDDLAAIAARLDRCLNLHANPSLQPPLPPRPNSARDGRWYLVYVNYVDARYAHCVWYPRLVSAECAIRSYCWTHAPGLASHWLVPRRAPNPPAQPYHGGGASLRNASASSHRQQPMLPAVQKTLRRRRPPYSRNLAETLAAITPGDAAFAQVVGGKLHLHPISRHHAHKVQAHFA